MYDIMAVKMDDSGMHLLHMRESDLLMKHRVLQVVMCVSQK